MVSKGKRAAGKLKRAEILLAADAGCCDEEIVRTVAVGGPTVYRTKRRFVEGNLERALSEDPRFGAARKLTAKEEALLVARACASLPRVAPAGRWSFWLTPWSSSPNTEPVGRNDTPAAGRKRSQALAQGYVVHFPGEYVARLEDVLDLYAEAPDSRRPVVCFDQSPVQLIGEVRQPFPADGST